MKRLPKPIRKLLSNPAVIKLLIVAIIALLPGGQSHDFNLSFSSPSGYVMSVAYKTDNESK
jgi:hypothetical protein